MLNEQDWEVDELKRKAMERLGCTEEELDCLLLIGETSIENQLRYICGPTFNADTFYETALKGYRSRQAEVECLSVNNEHLAGEFHKMQPVYEAVQGHIDHGTHTLDDIWDAYEKSCRQADEGGGRSDDG